MGLNSKNEMLASVAVIESHTAALRAEIVMLPDEPKSPLNPFPPTIELDLEPTPTPELEPEVPDDLEPPLEPPLPPVLTLPALVRDVELSAEQTGNLERLFACSTFKLGGTREAYNLDGLSKSGRLNDVSRHLSLGGAAVIAALRFTGRRELLERLYGISQNLRDTIASYFGFRGWVIHDPGEKTHGQITPMESLMANAFIAELAWTFRRNQGVDPKYKAHADFWLTYLIKDFVGYWAKRNGRSAPPYVEKELAHPYAASIRLSHYLWKLTDDAKWRNERDRQINVLMDELFLVGDRYVVGHFINSLKKAPLSHAISHAEYFGEFLTSIADLGFEGVLSETVMTRFARTVNFMIDGKTPGLMKGANGVAGTYFSPLLGKDWMMQPMEHPRGSAYTMRARGYALMAYWDNTSEIKALAKQVDEKTFCQPIVGLIGAGAR